MALHRVTKSVHFSYGHRVLGHHGKCRYLHGHNGIVEVDVEASNLDLLGMVKDFGNVKEVVKGWVDTNLDHRMVLCENDPAVHTLIALGEPLYLVDENPTAENLAKLIHNASTELGLNVTEVRFWETPTSRATYRG